MGRLRSHIQNPLPFYILSEFLTVALQYTLQYTLSLKMAPLSHAWNTVTVLGISTDVFNSNVKTKIKNTKHVGREPNRTDKNEPNTHKFCALSAIKQCNTLVT